MECMLQVFSMTAHVAALRQDHRKYAAKYPRDRGNRGVMGDCCRVVDARHCFQVVMSLLSRLIAGATTLLPLPTRRAIHWHSVRTPPKCLSA